MTTKPTIDEQIEDIVGKHWAMVTGQRPIYEHATSEETAQAIKALLTEARIDQTVHLKAELLAKLPQPYRSPNELDPKAPRDIYAEGISVGEKRVLYEITKIVKEL